MATTVPPQLQHPQLKPELLLPDAFKTSYKWLERYPQNLIYKTSSSYPAALRSHFDELKAASATLFELNEDDVQVHFREIVDQCIIIFRLSKYLLK